MYANSKGQNLKDHLIAVGLVCYWKAVSLGLSREDAMICLMAGLMHDIGKAETGFRDHLMKVMGLSEPSAKKTGDSTGGDTQASEDELEDGVFGAETGRDAEVTGNKKAKIFAHHHEVSWAVLSLTELSAEAPNEFRQLDQVVRWLAFHHHSRKYWDRAVGFQGKDTVNYFPDSAQILAAISEESVTAVATLCVEMIQKFNELTNMGRMMFIRGGASAAAEGASEKTALAIPDLFEGLWSRGKPQVLSVRSLQRSALVWSDRKVSALTPSQVAEIAAMGVEGAQEWWQKLEKNGDRPPLVLNYSLGASPSTRSLAQKALASKAAQNVSTVLAAPCGYGKSRIALLWYAELPKEKRRQLLWVVPRNAIATGIASQMDEELAAIGLEHVSWELFLGSSRVSASKNAGQEPFSADIVITNLDNVLSPYVRHAWADRIGRVNSAAVVFDEFHEFASASPLFATFITMMAGRHNITKAPSLLVSATPLRMWPLWESPLGAGETVLMNDVPPLSDKDIQISAASTMGAAITAVKNGGVCVMNAVQAAQKHNIEAATTMIAHSNYTQVDKEAVLGRVLATFGKDSCKENRRQSLSAGPIVQASLGVSFTTVVDSLCSPESTLQRLGRLDRFLSLEDPRYVALFLPPKESREDFSACRSIYDGELVNSWRACMEDFAKDRHVFRMQEMVNLYKKFSNDHAGEVNGWLSRLRDQAFSKLNQVPPQRAPKRRDKDTAGRATAKGNLRDPDGSYYITAWTIGQIGVENDVLGPDEVISVSKEIASKIAEELAGDREALRKILAALNKRDLGFTYPTRGRSKRAASQITDQVLTKEGLLKAARNPTSPIPASLPWEEVGRRRRYFYHRAVDGGPGRGLIKESALYGAEDLDDDEGDN